MPSGGGQPHWDQGLVVGLLQHEDHHQGQQLPEGEVKFVHLHLQVTDGRIIAPALSQDQ